MTYLMWACLLVSSAILLFPITGALLGRRSLCSLEVALSVMVWAMYYPFFFMLNLGIVEHDANSFVWFNTAMFFATGCNICWALSWICFPRRKKVNGLASNAGNRFRTNKSRSLPGNGFRSGQMLTPNSLDDGPIEATRSIRSFVYLLLLLGIVGAILQFVSIPWEAHVMVRDQIRQRRNLLLGVPGRYLTLNLLIAAAVGTFYRRKRPWLMIIPLATYSLFTVAWFISVRSRTYMLSVIIILMFTYGISPGRFLGKVKKRWQTREKVMFFRIALLILGVVVLATVSKNMRGYIHMGFDRLTQETKKVSISETIEKSFETGDLAYGRMYFPAFEIFPDQHSYLYGASYFTWPLGIVPRAIIPFKPLNTQRVYCSVINPQMAATGGTIPPTIYGDAYINFGYLGFIIFFFTGGIMRWIDRTLAQPGNPQYKQAVLIAIIALTSPHFARGGFHNAMMVTIVTIVSSTLLGWVAGLNKQSRNTSHRKRYGTPPLGRRVVSGNIPRRSSQ